MIVPIDASVVFSTSNIKKEIFVHDVLQKKERRGGGVIGVVFNLTFAHGNSSTGL